MASCIMEIKDNPATGEVDIECRLEDHPNDRLPTGAGIIHAYLAAHIEGITEDAKSWFRAKLVDAAAKVAPEIQQ